MIQLVFAFNKTNGQYGFGNKNRLPWPHCKEDLQNFKKHTLGSCLVMGANTFKSLPGKLPDRPHYVVADPNRYIPVTRNNEKADGYFDNLYSILDMCKEQGQTVSVIGGVELLLEASKSADRILATQIEELSPSKADTYVDYENIVKDFKLHRVSTIPTSSDKFLNASMFHFERKT